jgi:hypothetical protein
MTIARSPRPSGDRAARCPVTIAPDDDCPAIAGKRYVDWELPDPKRRLTREVSIGPYRRQLIGLGRWHCTCQTRPHSPRSPRMNGTVRSMILMSVHSDQLTT